MPLLFLNSSVKHLPILIIFGTWHCCYTTLRNAEVVVWPLTTMNSYWAAHALAQKLLTE